MDVDALYSDLLQADPSTSPYSSYLPSSLYSSSSPGDDLLNQLLLSGGLNMSRLCLNSSAVALLTSNGTSEDFLNCSDSAAGEEAARDLVGAYERDRLFDFIVNGCGITIVALLGIVGNMLSGVVLSRPQMRSSVTCLLLGLAFCDSLLVFTSMLLFGLGSLADFTGTLLTYRLMYYPLWVPFLYPISLTAQTASVYLTLAVTLERYVAVCHPLRARSLCTWRRARICVSTVLFLAVVYNLPRWWEVRTVEVFSVPLNGTIFENAMSDMRRDPVYINVYINWAYLVVMYMVPFSGLVAFNLAIYRQVRKANRERQVLSKLQRREMGLASMLLCVVFVFLLCNILPLVNNILESFYDRTIDHLVQMSNLLVVVNSSVNFVIYCTCGERFRRLLLRICRDALWCRLGQSRNQNSSRRNNSFYRKSHLYRGGDAEDVSMNSVGTNHTCLSNGGPNASLIVLNAKTGNVLRNGCNNKNFRSKTIPVPRSISTGAPTNTTTSNGAQHARSPLPNNNSLLITACSHATGTGGGMSPPGGATNKQCCHHNNNMCRPNGPHRRVSSPTP